MRAFRGLGLQTSLFLVNRTVLGKQAIEGESPVHENEKQAAGSRVPRDTWNLAGRRGDHPPTLNTTQ